MDDLLVYIARELVSNPDEVNVKKTEQNGKRAQAIRSIMKAKYLKEGKRVIVDIVG